MKIIFICIVITILLIVINNFIFKLLEKRSTAVHIRFLHSLIRIVIIAIAIYTTVSFFPQAKEISATALRSGSVLLALITFAAQQTLGNVIGGFSLSISKPYQIGQKIKVMNGNQVEADGIVTGMTMRHTIIHQYDDQECIVPNSVMNSRTIINMDYTDGISSILQFIISNSNDIVKAKEIIKKVCLSEDILNKKSFEVYTYDTDLNGIIVRTGKICVRNIDENYKIRSNIIDNVISEFNKAHISLSSNTTFTVKGNKN